MPGVLGNEDSQKKKALKIIFWSTLNIQNLKNGRVKSPPEVLFSGDHAKIKGWRLSQSEAITRRQRPDLWKKYLDKKNEKH